MSIRECAAHPPTPQALGEAQRRLREQSPLIHCLTNRVTINRVATSLLAIGAAPVMADHPAEAGDVARQASAVLVNLGTPSDNQIEAMHRAIAAAGEVGVPWVLDPVGAGALTLRRRWAEELLAHRPTLLRGNAAEVIALGSQAEGGGRGVDSNRASSEARDAARRLLARCGGVAVSGVQDRLVARAENDGRECPLELGGLRRHRKRPARRPCACRGRGRAGRSPRHRPRQLRDGLAGCAGRPRARPAWLRRATPRKRMAGRWLVQAIERPCAPSFDLRRDARLSPDTGAGLPRSHDARPDRHPAGPCRTGGQGR